MAEKGCGSTGIELAEMCFFVHSSFFLFEACFYCDYTIRCGLGKQKNGRKELIVFHINGFITCIVKGDSVCTVESPETGDNTILVMGQRRSVSVNVEKKELLHVDGKDLSEMEHNVVLDLSDDGERWEGDVLEGIPCGWGVLYNSEGEKEYEGFRIGRVNVGYGIQYYSDLQRIEYEGEMCIGNALGERNPI